MFIEQKEIEILGVKSPLLKITPNGRTENEYCLNILESIPDSHPTSPSGPVDIFVVHVGGKGHLLMNQIYIQVLGLDVVTKVTDITYCAQAETITVRLKRYLKRCGL